MATYLTAFADLSQEQIVLAFSRAATECKFFPTPATLREYAGLVVSGDPIAAEAKAELVRIVTAMRGPHGPRCTTSLAECCTAPKTTPRRTGFMHPWPIRFQTNRLRATDELLAKWTAAYRD